MRINEKIKMRRIELGLTESDMSSRVGLTRSEYTDIELHEDEIISTTDLGRVKKICEVLGFDIFELLEQKCTFCVEGMPFAEDYSLPRNELIANKRRGMGISMEELGERIGFYEAEIELLEKDPDHLDTWPIDYIRDLAAVIDLSVQVLMKVRCNKCGKGTS